MDRYRTDRSQSGLEKQENQKISGHRFKLRQQRTYPARRKFAFPVRIVEPWNKLPPEVVLPYRRLSAPVSPQWEKIIRQITMKSKNEE